MPAAATTDGRLDTISLASRAGRVYDAEREQAIRQQYDAEYAVRLASIAGRRVMARAVPAVINAWREHRSWSSVLSQALDRVSALARDAMVYGVLKGRERALRELQQHPRSASKLDKQQRRLASIAASHCPEWDDTTLILDAASPVFTRAISALRKRSILSEKELRAIEQDADSNLVRVVAKVNADAQRELMQTVTRITGEGLHVREGTSELRDAFDRLGLSSYKPYQLEAVFRTQTQLAYAAGQQQILKSDAIDEILWGYKYITAGDDRVREEHAMMDGTTLPKEDPFWLRNTPPNGWNCRCQIIAKFDELKPVRPSDTAEADKGFRFNPDRIFSATPPVVVPSPPRPQRKPE